MHKHVKGIRLGAGSPTLYSALPARPSHRVRMRLPSGFAPCTAHRDDSAERAPGQRVGDIIRVKLGSFEHTRVAISRRMGLRRSDLPDPMRQQVLQCPCGRGQQDAYHVWHECPHSERLMKDACSSIDVLQLPGWGTLSTRARVKGLMTVTTCASTEAQRTLKGRAASVVACTMQRRDMDLHLDNIRWPRQLQSAIDAVAGEDAV